MALSIRQLLDDMSVEEPTNDVISEVNSVDISEVEKTAEYLEKLASPDRLIDQLAKLAVLQDLLGHSMDKKAAFPMAAAKRAVKGAKKEVIIQDNLLHAERLSRKAQATAEKVKHMRDHGTDGSSKLLTTGAGSLVAGAAGGTYVANQDKNKDLKQVAQKYYNLGRTS